MNTGRTATAISYRFLFKRTQIKSESFAEEESERYSVRIFPYSIRCYQRNDRRNRPKLNLKTGRSWCNLQQTSWAVVIWQSLLGRGWKGVLLRMWWLEGRMRALLTHSPSTPPILTTKFLMADLLAFEWECIVEEEGEFLMADLLVFNWECIVFLWRLQRKVPAWFVGEHMHDLLGGGREMDFMEASIFGEMGWRADRTCDAELSWAKLIEDEAASQAEEE